MIACELAIQMVLADYVARIVVKKLHQKTKRNCFVRVNKLCVGNLSIVSRLFKVFGLVGVIQGTFAVGILRIFSHVISTFSLLSVCELLLAD